MIEDALVTHLNNDTGVMSLVSAPGARFVRVFPLAIPQKTKTTEQLPCLVYAVVGETRNKTYCGTSKLVMATLSLDSYAMKLSQARQLSSAVRAAIIDFRGVMGGKVRVRDVTHEATLTLLDMEPGVMRVADTYTLWYEEE
jgi:hypothetical protein